MKPSDIARVLPRFFIVFFQRVFGVENLGSVIRQKDLGIAQIKALLTDILNAQVECDQLTNSVNVALGPGDVFVHGMPFYRKFASNRSFLAFQLSMNS